jgi:hypothetical protein
VAVAAGALLASGQSVLGLTGADGAEGALLAVIGAVIGWHGLRVYAGRKRAVYSRGRVYLQRPALDLAAAWVGSGLVLAGAGLLVAVPPGRPAEIIAILLFVLGAAGILLGLVFYVYLPGPLRPAWLTGQQRSQAAAPEARRLPRRSHEPAGPREPAGPGQSEPAAADRPLRLVHHVVPAGQRSSEEEARDITGLTRPRLLVHGTISGPLPYRAEVSETPRRGALWVVPGRVLFVQSAEDDLALGETYFAEIPAGKLYGMRPGRSAAGRPALELDVDRGAVTFEYDGDPAALARDISEVLGP